jgi:nicotinamidase/pyrazinamidase
MKRILVIVDVQKDFYSPDGALYVKGAEVIPGRIADLIRKEKFFYVVPTLDWHPYNHCSFKKFGGIWPAHCVQFTEGSALAQEIIDSLYNVFDYDMFVKGTNPDMEEYGAFIFSRDNNDGKEKIKRYFKHADEIIVCGIAGDYCVKNTIANILDEVGTDPSKVFVWEEGVASIDDGTTLREYMSERGLKSWTPTK